MKIGSFTSPFQVKNNINKVNNNVSYPNPASIKNDTLPIFSSNQYLVNFKGLDHSSADIEDVKQELDNLFSEPEKITDPYKYDSYDNKNKFINFLSDERDDISKLAFSYLKKNPLVLMNLAADPNEADPLTIWGSGATKALLEYLEDKPKLKDKKDIVDELFLKEIKLKNGSKKLIGEKLSGEPFEFALECTKDKVKVYKILKENNKLSILNKVENPHVLVKFFDEIIQTINKK